MRVLLVKPWPDSFSWYRSHMVSLVYLASSLRDAGHKVRIIDGHFMKLDEDAVCRMVGAEKAGLVGITAMTHEIPRAQKIARYLKENGIDAPVVIGGPHATAVPERTLSECEAFDYVIAGEGENAIKRLADSLENGETPDDIPGLARRENGGVCFVPSEQEYVEPAEIPMPAVDLYYQPGHFENTKDDEYRIFTSRGCPYNCAFCMQVLGRKLRWRPVDDVIAEWRQAVELYKAKKVFVHDEIFLWNNERTHEILDRLIETGLNQKHYWYAMTRVELVDRPLLEKAKKAGCRRIYIGIESGNDLILHKIHREYTVNQAIEAVRTVKSCGLEVFTFFILGHPGESDGTVIDSILTAVRMAPTEMGMGIMVPYPGTEVYDLAAAGKEGYTLNNAGWEAYDRYGGEAMTIDGLPGKRLVKYQIFGYLAMYIYNLQFRNMIRYFAPKVKAVFRILIGKRL